MMNPQKQITTNAPSIRYEGDLRPEQAGIMQKHAQAMQQMQQQAMMQQQQPQQPMMQQPQGRMPAGRMPAMAMGGSMVGPTIETQGGIRGLNMPGYNDGGSVEDDANYKGWKKMELNDKCLVALHYQTILQNQLILSNLNQQDQYYLTDRWQRMVVSWVWMVENNMESVHGSRKKLWILLKTIL